MISERRACHPSHSETLSMRMRHPATLEGGYEPGWSSLIGAGAHRLVLEVIGDLPGIERPKQKALRETLAASLLALNRL
jgi:hypothetical protein